MTQASDPDPGQNYLNEIGAFTASASYYGAFDLTGNVWEWTDLAGQPGPFRSLRGGA